MEFCLFFKCGDIVVMCNTHFFIENNDKLLYKKNLWINNRVNTKKVII